MCIDEIVRFFENWISGQDFINSGEFSFSNENFKEDEINLFSLNLTNALFTALKEKFTPVSILETILVASVNGNNFECYIVKSGVGGDEYYWSVEFLHND